MSSELKDTVKDHHNNGVEGGGGGSNPSECDPCIEERKSRGRVLWGRTEKKLRDKSGLTRNGLYYVGGLLMLLFTLLIVIVTLVANWPTTPHHRRFPVCKSDSCLRASSQIQLYLNQSASQCRDVWNWACGSWMSHRTIPDGYSKWNQRQELRQQEATRIRDLITTLPLPLHTNTVKWKLKHFYESCVEIDNVNTDEARPLTSIISELGGWYVLRDWNMVDFDYMKILKQLHVKFGVSPYFKISVIPNPREPGNSSISISPSGLGLPDRNYYYAPQKDTIVAAYKQLIRDIVINLGAPKANAETFGNDVFFYEQRIAEMTPETSDLLDPIHSYNPIHLSELKLTSSTLPLHDILTAMYPSANVDDNTEIIVTHPDYLLKVSQIISSTDRKSMNGYMIWTLVREYLPYLSTQYTSAIDAFHNELLGVAKPFQRWEFCANLVQRFMPLAIDALIDKANPVRNKTNVVINDIFKNIQKAAKAKLNKYNSIPELYTHLEKKISTLNLQIGLPAVAKTETFQKDYYTRLQILKANLFESYKYGIIFLKTLDEGRLSKNGALEYVINEALSDPFRVHYVPSNNTIIVPRVLLSAPYFEDQYPSSIIYGRLGMEIAEAVATAILPFKSAWTAEGKLLSSYHESVNESSRLIRHSMHCLTEFAKDNNLAETKSVNLTSLNTYKYLSSLNLARDALKFGLENAEHVHQPALEVYEDSALFYISHIQSFCSLSTKHQNLYDNVVEFQLSEESLLEVAWKQHVGISEAFNCYSPSDKCNDIL